MTGLLVLVGGPAGLAGVSAFLITYEEALHRFPKRQAQRHGLRTGAVAAAFFAGLGALLVALLFR
jgi:hypothetical protein